MCTCRVMNTQGHTHMQRDTHAHTREHMHRDPHTHTHTLAPSPQDAAFSLSYMSLLQ